MLIVASVPVRCEPTVPPGSFHGDQALSGNSSAEHLRHQRRSGCPPSVSPDDRYVLHGHRLPRPPGLRWAVSDLHARTTLATPGQAPLRRPAPRWCARPPRPHGTGPAPAATDSVPRGPPRPPGGLARAMRSPESREHRWRARGGGARLSPLRLRALVTCDMGWCFSWGRNILILFVHVIGTIA